MSFQPRWQMVQLMALLAFTAAAWMIAVAAHAAGPSEAIIATAETEDGNAEADGGPGPETAAEPGAKHSSKVKAAAAEPAAAPDPPKTIDYVVQPGDSLSEIADAHGVRLADLIAANGISKPDDVDAGATLKIPVAEMAPPKAPKPPEGVRITVPKGVTLSRIAEIYGIPWKRIAKANGLGSTGRVRSGQKLFIPGATKVLEIVPCLKAPVALYRVRTDETQSVSLCRCNGEANPAGVAALTALSSSPRETAPFNLDDRLAQLLQKVADRFPGKRLELISGYRPPKQSQKTESLHNKGRAIDFRVEGVSNAKLVGLAKTFDKVGVGYYPNSVFIHLDARQSNGYWVDYSRPGEKAIYGRAGMKPEEIEKIRLARRSAAAEAEAQADPEAQSDAENGTGAEAEAAGTVDVGTLAKLVQAAVAEALADPSPDPAPAEAPAVKAPSPAPAAEAKPVTTPIAVNVTPES
jgi:uncharacterized protein YcbK (DUF882 family)